jgi:hypothetical protein
MNQENNLPYDPKRLAVKAVVRAFADAQKVRLAQGNRVIQAGLLAAGIDPRDKAQVNKQGAEKQQMLLADFDALLQVSDDDLSTLDLQHRQFVKLMKTAYLPHGLLSDYVTALSCATYRNLERQEQKALLNVKRALKGFPIWEEFLSQVRGCGESIGGTIVAEIDIHKAKYASSLWKYAGLDVAQDGRGRSRRSEHLVDIEYEDKSGKKQTKRGITFNPTLKTKLYLLAEAFIKAGGEYREIYDKYKHRLENHSIYGKHNDGKEIPGVGKIQPGRRHHMAMRYAEKRFLVDLYIKWRTMEGLEVHKEYSEAKLGLTHKAA